MLRRTVRNIFFGLVSILCSLPLMAQEEAYGSYSPYSMYGIGDLTRFGTAYNRSMGGVGIATRDKRNINILNPAAVTERDPQSFMLDFSLAQGNRYYAQGDIRSSNNTFNVNSIILSTPVWKSLAMYAGITPYSNIGYKISAFVSDPGIVSQTGAILNTVQGYGGLTKAFLGGGYFREPPQRQLIVDFIVFLQKHQERLYTHPWRNDRKSRRAVCVPDFQQGLCGSRRDL